MIYVKEGQYYNSVINRINDLEWTGVADRRRDLTQFYKIVNHDVMYLLKTNTYTSKGSNHIIHLCIDGLI